jgi:Lipopolysaccharide kinase (Kdo/WaaP) family
VALRSFHGLSRSATTSGFGSRSTSRSHVYNDYCKLIPQTPIPGREWDFLDYKIESLPSVKSWSRSSGYQSWVPDDLAGIPKDLVIKEWSEVAKGTHGLVRKMRIEHGGFESVVCCKLFTEKWKDEYEREVKAYGFLYHRKVQRCIPRVFWKGDMPVWWWNGSSSPPASPVSSENGDSPSLTNSSKSDKVYYGIVMEYFDDYQELDWSRLDIPTAEAVGRALTRVHSARVMHGDMEERNILLVRESGSVRVVLIDFTCAWLNAYPEALDEEWGFFLFDLVENMV